MPTEESNPLDFSVSAEEFLKSPEFYPDLSIIDGRAVRYPQLEPSPPDRRGDVPEEERLDWLGVFLTYRPAWLNLSAMDSISRAHREGRLVTIGLWTPVAIAFHAIGFSPALYRELRVALDELLGEDDHPLLRVVPSKFGPRCTVLRASDWAEWPRMVEDGMPALEATRQILETRA